MQQETQSKKTLVDSSRIIVEACAKAGADVFVGYPITPTNLIFSYSFERFPLALAAADEITTLQLMAGLSAAGKFPVTGTSFPGLALMVESINMAFMMELPMLIILSQRLGPSTGSATTGAQGDLLLLRGLISGGYQIPVFCPSDFEDCWTLTHQGIQTAISLRTPVVLLTSKEMGMTNRSFDLSQLPPLKPVDRKYYEGKDAYLPYAAKESQAPDFLPLGNKAHRVRLNASTHGEQGLIRKATPEAMANTTRLHEKITNRVSEFASWVLDEKEGSDTLLVSYGITAGATLEAQRVLNNENRNISLLILKTLLPLAPAVKEIINRYNKVVIAEENMTGLLKEVLYGQYAPQGVKGVNKIGKMITPDEIIKELKEC